MLRVEVIAVLLMLKTVLVVEAVVEGSKLDPLVQASAHDVGVRVKLIVRHTRRLAQLLDHVPLDELVLPNWLLLLLLLFDVLAHLQLVEQAILGKQGSLLRLLGQ